jgi:NAD(P)-dependent dehydrogenase (short-subunit alcohol dehydrogenase family)
MSAEERQLRDTADVTRGGSMSSQPAQQREVPGLQSELTPKPDCGEQSYVDSGKLAELAPAHALLASDDGSYVSGARIAVTGGNPIL